MALFCVSDPALHIMMSRRGRSKNTRIRACTGQCEPQSPGIHVFLYWTKDGERYLSHTTGEVTAEELCVSAAQAIGEANDCCLSEARLMLFDVVFSSACWMLSGCCVSVAQRRLCSEVRVIWMLPPYRDHSTLSYLACPVRSNMPLLVQPKPHIPPGWQLQPGTSLPHEVRPCLYISIEGEER